MKNADARPPDRNDQAKMSKNDASSTSSVETVPTVSMPLSKTMSKSMINLRLSEWHKREPAGCFIVGWPQTLRIKIIIKMPAVNPDQINQVIFYAAGYGGQPHVGLMKISGACARTLRRSYGGFLGAEKKTAPVIRCGALIF